MEGVLEVRALPAPYRAYTVAVWLACAAFFAWAAYTYPTRGHVIGYIIGGICLWSALYWLRAPDVLVRADATGLTYADTRLGVLLVFREAHAAWSDVLAVDTGEVASRYGSFVRTRVTVRAEGGAGTRRFIVTSRAQGYVAFLEALHAHTEGSAAVMKGMGDDPAQARLAIRGLTRGRLQALALFALLSIVMIIVAWLRRR